MSNPTERSLLEGWRRGWPVPGTFYPYAILVVSAASATSQWGSVSVNLALCAAAAAWMLIPLPPAARRRAWVLAVFMAGFIAITAILVVRDPWFGFLVAAGYGYAIRLMPWPWTLPCIGALAILAATAQTWSVNKGTPAGLGAYLGVIALNMFSVCGIVWFLHSIESVHDQRKRALDFETFGFDGGARVISAVAAFVAHAAVEAAEKAPTLRRQDDDAAAGFQGGAQGTQYGRGIVEIFQD